MKVIFLGPSYPPEMPDYVRGLAEVGATVYGVGDTPQSMLPQKTKKALSGYLQVRNLFDEREVAKAVLRWVGSEHIDRVETIWEPMVLTAATLREYLGCPGMRRNVVLGFRDKEIMKARIRAAGLRVPHSFRCVTESEIRRAADVIGFPIIIKPIAGAGSADTYRVDDQATLEKVLIAVRHVPEVSCEEFVEGEEFTFDGIAIDGRPAYINVAQYLPRPLVARTREDISPVICTIRNLGQPALRPGLKLGYGVLKALGMGTGFFHMEWYRKANGEVVFGEIGCRAGGAHLVDQMNYTGDIDLFREWARAVCWKDFRASTDRKYNCAIIFKRAHGQGRIQGVEGLDQFRERYHRWICTERLLPVGSHRRNWKQTLVSDGFMMVRHPEWHGALELADAVARTVHLHAETP